MADWAQTMQSDLRAGQLVLDDATLRRLVEQTLPAQGGQFVKIHQLQQVCFLSHKR